MQHYTILIIDDKREQAKEIKKKIEALHPAFHADIANDASYALKGTYDAYLSDLMMPVHSGIEIGNMIYKENPDAIIILMSSLDNFAIERTQQFSAFTFLPKSKLDQELLPLLQHLERRLNYINIRIHVKEGEKSIAVPIYKIHKVSVIKKQLCLDMGNTRYTCSMRLQDFQRIYDDYFVCPKTGLLINPSCGYYYEAGHTLQLKEESIRVSLLKRKEFKEKYQKYYDSLM